MTLANQAAFWNEAAATKRFTHPLDLQRLSREVGRDAAILDYGCGQGRLCGELAGAGFTNLLGVDSSSAMIQLAQQQHAQPRFEVADGFALQRPDASFDCVLLFAVLTCIPSDDAQRNLLRELRRVLRPDGLLLVSDYPLQQDQRNRARYRQYELELGPGAFRLPDGGVVRHHRNDWFAELLSDFRITDTCEIDSHTMNGHAARIVQIWARAGNGSRVI